MSTIGQVLIGKNVAYGLLRSGATIASFNDINNLTDGAVAIFNDDNHFVDAAADFLDSKFFWIAVGGATNKKTRLSKKIYRNGLNVLGRAYVAPVLERMFIGDNATSTYDLNLATIVAGQDYSVVVEQRTEVNMSQRKKKTYTYVAKTGDTKAIIAAAIAALITADADALVTCTVIGTTFTGLRFDFLEVEPLAIYPQGYLSDAPVFTYISSVKTNTIAPIAGTGTAAQILALEQAAMLNEGDGNTVAWNNEMFSYADQTDSTATYHQWALSWNPVGSYPAGNFNGVPQWFILAVVTGASQISTLATLIIAAAAVGTAASASESGVAEENEAIVS